MASVTRIDRIDVTISGHRFEVSPTSDARLFVRYATCYTTAADVGDLVRELGTRCPEIPLGVLVHLGRVLAGAFGDW